MTWICVRILFGMSPWFGTDSWNQQDVNISVCINNLFNTNNWNSQIEGSCRTQIKKGLKCSWNTICVVNIVGIECKNAYKQLSLFSFLKSQ